MLSNTFSHRRQRSAGFEDNYYFGNASSNHNRSASFINRPFVETNQSLNQRDHSADALGSRSLNSSLSNSPYIDGKRNSHYQNPNLKSSQVFYEHNYGYKNDMPNDRLLTPVKNDRFRKDNEAVRTLNRGDRTPMRGDRTPSRGDMTPNREERVVLTPTRPQNEERFTRSRQYEPQYQYHYEEEYAPTRQPERRERTQRNVEFERSRREIGNERRDSRKNSAISEPPQRSTEFDFRPREEREPILRNRNERAAAGRPSGVNLRGSQVEDSIRDDRSEASTIVSTLSTTTYVCPKCLNRHMAGDKNTRCMVDKHVVRESERRLADINRQYLQEAEEQKKQARARRVEDSKLLQQQLQKAYIDKINKRRFPDQEQVTTFDNIFNRQEEHDQLKKALGESFRVHLKDQIRYVEQEKEREKKANLKPYETSLPIGEGYNNRFLENPQSVKATLKDQVEEKLYNKLRDQEKEKKIAQARIEQAQRQLEEERQMKKDKERNQKIELQEAYKKAIEEKEAKKREQLTKKHVEKYHADRGYNEYKQRQQEAEDKFKKQLAAFRQGLSTQKEEASYKKMYQDRKQKEGTSFGPQRKTKKVYPCGECSGLYEKVHLTKL